MRLSTALLLLLTGCTGPLASLNHKATLTVPSGTYTLRTSDPDAGATEQSRFHGSLERISPLLGRWGKLPKPVTLYVVPDHATLEEAVNRHGYGWLRAWAKYDDIVLQSPRTWAAGPKDITLDKLLLHELTHCLLFQRSGNALTWRLRGIPMWFREGMATVTAGQGAQFPALEDLRTWAVAHPDLDVFTDGDALSKNWFNETYGLAHHAFAFLVKRYGDAAVQATMTNLGFGFDFPDAFERAVGIPVATFTGDFMTWLRLRGFRGYGLTVKPKAPSAPASDGGALQ